jgi:hypothetical protein
MPLSLIGKSDKSGNRTTEENVPNRMKGRAMTTGKAMGAGHFPVYFLVAGAKTMW